MATAQVYAPGDEPFQPVQVSRVQGAVHALRSCERALLWAAGAACCGLSSAALQACRSLHLWLQHAFPREYEKRQQDTEGKLVFASLRFAVAEATHDH